MGQDNKNTKEKEAAELAQQEADTKALAEKEAAELAEKEKTQAEKVMKPRRFKLKEGVANVFIDGQKYTHRDSVTFAENPSVLKKFKDGFLTEI